MTRKNVDDVAVEILLFVQEQPGEYFATEPGDLIKTVADETGNTYSQTGVAIRYLEEIGFIWVGRQSGLEPRQHNLLYEIRIVKDREA